MYAALKQVAISDEDELEDYTVEIDILTECKHPNIVGLYEAFYFGGKLWVSICKVCVEDMRIKYRVIQFILGQLQKSYTVDSGS